MTVFLRLQVSAKNRSASTGRGDRNGC
jgi:hypothetical protein